MRTFIICCCCFCIWIVWPWKLNIRYVGFDFIDWWLIINVNTAKYFFQQGISLWYYGNFFIFTLINLGFMCCSYAQLLFVVWIELIYVTADRSCKNFKVKQNLYWWMDLWLLCVFHIWCVWRECSCMSFVAEQMICEKNWALHRKSYGS